jgi:hypothetical protein
MPTQQFSHVYSEGPLRGTGVWQFESEWSTAGQRLGWRTLEWKGRREGDTQWRRRVVETDHRISVWTISAAHENLVRQHILGAFALGESCLTRHRAFVASSRLTTFVPSSRLTNGSSYAAAMRPTVYRIRVSSA